MNSPYTREQILEGLVIDIADCLAIEPEVVTPDAFFSELDGESIEYLDLSFRIQKRFGIRVGFQELLGTWEFDSTGRLSDSSLSRLNTTLPGIDWPKRFETVSKNNRYDPFTVDLNRRNHISFPSHGCPTGISRMNQPETRFWPSIHIEDFFDRIWRLGRGKLSRRRRQYSSITIIYWTDPCHNFFAFSLFVD